VDPLPFLTRKGSQQRESTEICGHLEFLALCFLRIHLALVPHTWSNGEILRQVQGYGKKKENKCQLLEANFFHMGIFLLCNKTGPFKNLKEATVSHNSP
jgi:hypothetical protein